MDLISSDEEKSIYGVAGFSLSVSKKNHPWTTRGGALLSLRSIA